MQWKQHPIVAAQSLFRCRTQPSPKTRQHITVPCSILGWSLKIRMVFSGTHALATYRSLFANSQSWHLKAMRGHWHEVDGFPFHSRNETSRNMTTDSCALACAVTLSEAVRITWIGQKRVLQWRLWHHQPYKHVSGIFHDMRTKSTCEGQLGGPGICFLSQLSAGNPLLGWCHIRPWKSVITNQQACPDSI